MNAARTTGQAMQDKVAIEEFVVQPKARDAADNARRGADHPPAGSSTDAPTRSPTHRYIGTPRATPPSASTQPEAIRFPYLVAGEHMKVVFTHLKDYYDAPEIWARAAPNFLGGGTQFGILFATQADAIKFTGMARQRQYSYNPPTTSLSRYESAPRGHPKPNIRAFSRLRCAPFSTATPTRALFARTTRGPALPRPPSAR